MMSCRTVKRTEAEIIPYEEEGDRSVPLLLLFQGDHHPHRVARLARTHCCLS